MNATRASALVLLLSASFAVSLPAHADAVDDYVQSEMKKQNIPGLSLAVVKNGKVIKAQGYGWANVDQKTPVTPRTVFQLQSITKTFTATAIMMLVEEGKVGLDDKIEKYLGTLPAAWSNVTVRHLLTHTSGIKDFINEPTVDLKKDITPEEVVQSLANLPLNFATGEKYSYSNTGYHLLGMIIHKITGKVWGEFLRERIFEPLKMADTRVITKWDDVPNHAAGYGWNKDKLEPGKFIAPTILAYAGGGVRSTVLDMAKWDAALYGHKILKRSSLNQMWTPATLNNGSRTEYGFGWSVDDYRGHFRVGHSGAHMTGFKTTITRFVHDKVTVIVLTNQRAANPESIAVGVAARYLPGLLLSSLKEKPEPDPERTLRLKKCLMDLAEKKDSPLLTPGFRADFAKSTSRAETLSARLKALKSFTFLACDDVRKHGIERFGTRVSRICNYKMIAGDETRYYTFYLAEDGQVAFYQSSTE